MAGKVVDVSFRLKDEFTKPFGGIKSSLADANQQFSRAGQQIQNFGKKTQKVGSSLTKSVTMPIIGAGTVAAAKFAEVDKTMSLVNATMGNSAKDANALNSAMEEAAANSTFGMNDAAQAALNFARGGWDATQASEALAPAMNLAAGEGGSLETVSAGLMATMNSFKAPADQAAHYADVFAAACNNSALDVDSLSNSMSVAAPIFQTSGGSLEDATLAMGVMANAGIDAGVAANSLKTGIARLASPTDEAAAAMEQLGINAFDSHGNLKDMAQLQGELSDAFSGLNGQEKEAAASAIFGKNQMAPWLALIGTAPKDVNALADSLGSAKGTTDKMSDAMMSGFGGSIEKLKSSFDVFMTSMGKAVSTVLVPIISHIQTFVDKLNNMDDAQKKQLVKFALMAAAAGPALIVFGKLTTGIGKVVSVLGKVGKAFKLARSLFTLLNIPGLAVVGVLAGIAVAAVLVVKNWKKIKSAGMSVWNWLKGTLAGVGITSESVKDKLREFAGKFVDIGLKVRSLWTIAKPYVMKVFDVFKSVFAVMIPAMFGGFIGVISGVLKSIGDFASGALQMFGGIIDFVTGVFTGNWSKAWDGVKNIFGGAFKALTSLAKTPLNAVIGLINGAIAGINKLGITVPDWVPGIGGRAFSINIPKIPLLAVGTPDWVGGLAQINEKGGEIVDLPRGSRVYPHDESVRRAYKDGRNSGGITINIPKLADCIKIREDADIDRLVSALTNRIVLQMANVG